MPLLKLPGRWPILACLCVAGVMGAPVGCQDHGGVVDEAGDVHYRDLDNLPSDRHEDHGPAPSPYHEWVHGHWDHGVDQYVWVPGHWELRPRSGASYVDGHYVRADDGWHWEEGYWK